MRINNKIKFQKNKNNNQLIHKIKTLNKIK